MLDGIVFSKISKGSKGKQRCSKRREQPEPGRVVRNFPEKMTNPMCLYSWVCGPSWNGAGLVMIGGVTKEVGHWYWKPKKSYLGRSKISKVQCALSEGCANHNKFSFTFTLIFLKGKSLKLLLFHIQIEYGILVRCLFTQFLAPCPAKAILREG